MTARRKRLEVVAIGHHVAACAEEVEAAIARARPDVVCVQLPRDAAPLVPALREVKRFPVALFGHGPGAHAWLPLSERSPEVAALRAPCEVALVDVPLEHAVDAAPAWPRLREACERLGAGPTELVERLADQLGTELGGTLAELAGSGAPTHRERAMAAAIRVAARGAKSVVVVAGAAHAAALDALVREPDGLEAPASSWRIDLVPYDDARLHATGAHRFPRWGRLERDERTLARIVTLVGRAARAAQLPIGPAEEAEAVALATALAHLRGSTRAALADLLDAIRLVVVGDRAGAGDGLDAFGPLATILARVLVGGRRGAVPAGTAVLPIVADYRAALVATGIADGELRLDIHRAERDRAKSRLLHALAVLEVPGYDWLAGPHPEGEGGMQLMFERWSVDIGAAAEDALTELASRGTTVHGVARSVLEERLEACTLADAVGIAIRAHRLGADPFSHAAVLDRPARFVELGEALARLAGDPAFHALADAIAARAIHALGQMTAEPSDGERGAIHAIYVHAGDTAAFRDALARVHRVPSSPLLLGVTTALLHDLHALAPAAVVDLARMQGFAALAAPAELGRFLLGMTSMVPGILVRVTGLVAALDGAFAALSEDAFLAMVPDLRIAFSAMPAHAVERLVVELVGAGPVRAAAAIDPARRAAAFAALGLEARPVAPWVPEHRRLAAPARWRMVLGELAGRLGEPQDALARRRVAVLDELDRFERAVARGAGAVADRVAHAMAWLRETRAAFPADVATRLHDQAIHRYELHELLLDPEVLRTLEPSLSLAGTLLALRGAASPEVVEEIRRIVAAVVRRVRHLFEHQLRPILHGGRRTRGGEVARIARNFDLARTLRHNLRRYDPASERLESGLEPKFFARHRPRATWRLILLVDRSGSMASTVIDTTVLAGVFAGVPGLDVHLVLFDTEVVDVTALVSDPVELLLASSPGGGTDLRRPLAHAQTLVTAPRRTMVVLLSDLFHGGPSAEVVHEARNLLDAGVTLLALTALGPRGGDHDRELAGQLRACGARVAALAPDALARWLAARIRT